MSNEKRRSKKNQYYKGIYSSYMMNRGDTYAHSDLDGI